MKNGDDSSFWRHMTIYTIVGALSLTMQRLLLLVVVPIGVGGAIYYYRKSKKKRRYNLLLDILAHGNLFYWYISDGI